MKFGIQGHTFTVNGFMDIYSGFNMYNPEKMEVLVPDATSLEYWLKDYCGKHPLDYIVQAVKHL